MVLEKGKVPCVLISQINRQQVKQVGPMDPQSQHTIHIVFQKKIIVGKVLSQLTSMISLTSFNTVFFPYHKYCGHL